MRTHALFMLRVPWGLVGRSADRLALTEAGARPQRIAAISPFLVCDDDQPVLLNGRADALEDFSGAQSGHGARQRIWEFPVPLHADEPQILHHEASPLDFVFRWADGVGRPGHRSDGHDGVGERSGRAYRFVLGVMGRMQDFEAALSDGDNPWEFVLARWIDPAVARDPSMDVVVRHARDHRERWTDIADHLRRILSRRRELVPLSRVQELDTQCMRWLSRQPGEDLAERAGGHQRILALARYENRNTLENRIFRDLLERSVNAAREYLTLNLDRSSGATTRRRARIALVRQYQRECRNLSLDLARQGVDGPPELAQPNYVLLHDGRYRHVWTAWQEIIRRERAMDDLWRWQRRSWAEFCQSVVVMALLAQGRTHCVASSPLALRAEHRRGEWLMHDDPLAVVAHEEGGWVVEILGRDSCDVPDALRKLGASFWIRLSDCAGSGIRFVAVWAIHSPDTAASLDDLVESAGEACRSLDDQGTLEGGVVLLSTVDPLAPVISRAGGVAAGFEFGPADGQLLDALGRLGDLLSARIEAAL